jgi:hypothetical protein
LRKRSFFYDSKLGIVTKKRQIHTNLPVGSAYNAVFVVLKKMKTRIIQTMDNSGSISAYKGWSILSDGEVMNISISQSEIEQGCDIVVQSSSAFPKLWDLGVNTRNLNRFERSFRAIEHNPDNSP